MSQVWPQHAFDSAIVRNAIGRQNQIAAGEYKPEGTYPIVDQGQRFIAGYTEDEGKVVDEGLPYVIFGDHTRCFKYVDFPFVLGADGTKVLKPNAELFDPHFFYFALLGLKIPSRGYNRHYTLLREQKLPRPELGEQRQIARILATVERAIEQQKAIISTTRELKHSLIHKLFTEGLRGEMQKQTEIGLVPESWDVVPLDTLIENMDYGTSVKCDYDKMGLPVLRIPNVEQGVINTTDIKYSDLDEGALSTQILKYGDVLFVRTNGVQNNAGRCAVFHGELEQSSFASYLIRVQTQPDELAPDFLCYFCEMNQGKRQLAGRAARTADGKFNINTGTIKTMMVPKPKLDEQTEIVAMLTAAEAKLAVLASKQAYYADLFKTLLHQLMTAQLRVHDLDLDALGVPTLD